MVSAAAFTPAARAIDIQDVVSEKGIKAWLVESHSLPMISVNVAFRAGAVYDGKGKDGLSGLVASLMNEGAGDMDATAFQQATERLGVNLGASSDHMDMVVSLQTLSENRDEAFRLLGLAVTEPRFDNEAVVRMRHAMLSDIERGQEDPGEVAERAFYKAIYGAHPYSHAVNGEKETVAGLTRSDVEHFYKANFTRANMVVSVVGDISPAELKKLLDQTLGDLPMGTAMNAPPAAPVYAKGGNVQHLSMDVPQSHIFIGLPGLSRKDPDYYSAYVMNYVLGGGGFNSRLMEEVREKRGLAYSVSSAFEPMPNGGIFMANMQTKNADADKSIKLIKQELTRMAEKGVTEEEYKGAMQYLSGSFPLRLDSNRKILSYLTVMQLEDLGKDYLDKWVARVTAVTPADMLRAAKRFLKAGETVVVVVGKQEKASTPK